MLDFHKQQEIKLDIYHFIFNYFHPEVKLTIERKTYHKPNPTSCNRDKYKDSLLQHELLRFNREKLDNNFTVHGNMRSKRFHSFLSVKEKLDKRCKYQNVMCVYLWCRVFTCLLSRFLVDPTPCVKPFMSFDFFIRQSIRAYRNFWV